MPADRSAARAKARAERDSVDSGVPEIDRGITTTGHVAAYTIRWVSSGDIALQLGLLVRSHHVGVLGRA